MHIDAASITSKLQCIRGIEGLQCIPRLGISMAEHDLALDAIPAPHTLNHFYHQLQIHFETKSDHN